MKLKRLAYISPAYLYQQAGNIVQNKYVQHGVFWVLLFLLHFSFEDPSYSFWLKMSNTLLYLVFDAVIVYFNLYYLIPRFLVQKRVITYLAMLTLGIIVIIPIDWMAFYLKWMGHPELQANLEGGLYSKFLLLFSIAIVSSIIKIISDWLIHQRERKELKTQHMQSELKFLRSQVNPHFLFNTLNSLYALTLKKSDKAPEIVIKLSEMMRYMLYECNERYVPLHKEVNYIKNYLELESLRQSDSMDIRFNLRGEVNDQRIAPMMFIPFLENSFKHGLNKQVDKGYVHIEMSVKDHKVEMEIENSKPEKLPVLNGKRSGGIGLQNVRRRLNLLYPENYDLKITDLPDAYKVNLEINLN